MVSATEIRRFGEGFSGSQIARFRWIWLAVLATGTVLVTLFSEAEPPLAAVASIVLVGIVANALAMRHPTRISAPLMLDVVLLGALLGMFDGLANPFAALLPAAAFVGAVSDDPRSARHPAAMAVIVASVLAVTVGPGEPAAWLTICAMSGLAALTGLRFEAVAEARGDAAAALAHERATNATGLAFAAAAHEIATPLATIGIAAAELTEGAADRPETREDALLIRREALRCAAILDAARGRRSPERRLPISEVAGRAAAPHRDRGIEIRIRSEGTGSEPRVDHSEDAILGLRNIIQNAVDFARSDVGIGIRWTVESVEVTVSDDGDGFDDELLAGSTPEPGRPRPRGGPGSGNGLALARALLARGGGVMELDSASPIGARVRISWRRTAEHG